ncbi:MAG: hypothetical protein EOP19_31580 [Hyphomicrobiales bacterium]|nr:MAG: hypothetical protein EOP19_31580 [Hyphomicrobiales bacterium]
MQQRNRPGGLIMAAAAALGGCWLAVFLWRGLVSGQVPGKLGSVHYAGSTSYVVSLAACTVGIAMAVALVVAGLVTAGVIDKPFSKPGERSSK